MQFTVGLINKKYDIITLTQKLLSDTVSLLHHYLLNVSHINKTSSQRALLCMIFVLSVLIWQQLKEMSMNFTEVRTI